MHAQSPSLNNQFPHQSRDNAIRFNMNMRELFVSRDLIQGKDVMIMDWWNLTANAQSSDGVHQLDDANMAKAAHNLYLVEHWPLGKAEHYNMSKCAEYYGKVDKIIVQGQFRRGSRTSQRS